MKHEKLMRAIGEIDEDLILEAHEERRARYIWVRFAACAACFALILLATPHLLDMMGAGAAMEQDQSSFPEAENSKDAVLEDQAVGVGGIGAVPGEPNDVGDALHPSAEIEKHDGSVSTSTENVNKELLETIYRLKLQTALAEQGEAYPLETTIENEYGKVTFTDRSKSTVTMRVSLLSDRKLAVGSLTSGVWRLTVNGEAAEAFPDKAGVYEIVIDLSGDTNPTMLFVDGFGVFSIDAE